MMIRTENVVKKYNGFTAVNGISLNVRKGEIYGFLGPNGAGKTSMMRILTGILDYNEGEVSVLGERNIKDNISIRKRIGVVPENQPKGVFSWMKSIEYINTFADIFGVDKNSERINKLLEDSGAVSYRNKKINELSNGMLHKLSIVRALIHDPDILFLDEPITGLDPIGIKQIRDLLINEKKMGRTIFISSHLLGEVEKICDRVAIINNGELVAEENTNELLDNLFDEKTVFFHVDKDAKILSGEIKKMPIVKKVICKGKELEFVVKKEKEYMKDISKYIIERGYIPLKIQEKTISLEDAFVTITNENINMFLGSKK